MNILNTLGLKKTLLLLVVCTLIVATVANVFVAIWELTGYVNEVTNDEMDSSIKVFEQYTAAQLDRVTQEVKFHAANTILYDALYSYRSTGSSDALTKALSDMSRIIDSAYQYIIVTDANGVIIGSTDPAIETGAADTRASVSTARDGRVFSAIDESAYKDHQIAVISAAPIKNISGVIFGTIESGRTFSEPFVDNLKKMTGQEFTVFDGDTRLMTTLLNAEGKRNIGTKQTDTNIISTVFDSKTNYSGKSTILDLPFVTQYAPMVNGDGKVIGMYFTGIQLSDINNSKFSVGFRMVGIGLIVFVVSLLIIYYMVMRITRKMVGVMNELDGTTDDLSKESDKLTSMSSSLADGNTKQASNVEDTASIMNETSSMAVQNNENTNQISSMSSSNNEAINSANEKADQLMFSMKDLSASSEEILTVIKSISDIAKQTNILSLNASIEAARVGESGKGFAVVADEIRTLAARTAIAAQDTQSIISKNTDLSAKGLQMTEEVKTSLDELHKNLQSIGGIISEVKNASDEQLRGLEKANNAISQMEKITQVTASDASDAEALSDELKARVTSLESIRGDISTLIYGDKA
ncbi:hypothetical protein FACS1894105_01760 [Clostridia bacterium]|nr:hypothetical protein FACS1894105_01760 [Clostridia bacterium]